MTARTTRFDAPQRGHRQSNGDGHLVSMVIPTLNEATRLPALLADLRLIDLPVRIIVADGGSCDETVTLARSSGAAVVPSDKGRARQMNAGAQEAETPWLCFLHADVRFTHKARADLNRIVRDPRAQAAVWQLAIDAKGWWFRTVEWGARIRDRLGGLPYGDQGLLIRTALFRQLDGFPDYPVMEDVALVRAIQRSATIHRLPSQVTVSARRWRKEGAFLTFARNVALMTAYLSGVSPHRLSRCYPDHSS